MMEKEYLEIDEMIVEYLEGTDNVDLIEKLNRWIGESGDNRRYFENMRDIWIASTAAGIGEDKISKRKVFKITPLIRTISYVASLAAGIILAAFLFGGKSSAEAEMFAKCSPLVFSVPNGSTAAITLPDSTQVTLNAGSVLTVASDFGESLRKVTLRGEGRFSVKSDVDHPFIISTSDFDVMATGTVFNVRAYDSDPVYSATLIEGKIQVTTIERDTLNLLPNHTALYRNPNNQDYKDSRFASYFTSEGRLVDTTDNIDIFSSWIDGLWIIRNQSLGELAKDLERRYNLNVEFADDSIKQLKFSGTFKQERIDDILAILSSVLSINCYLKGDSLIVSK